MPPIRLLAPFTRVVKRFLRFVSFLPEWLFKVLGDAVVLILFFFLGVSWLNFKRFISGVLIVVVLRVSIDLGAPLRLLSSTITNTSKSQNLID
jgi:hypothetical protein